MFLGAVVETKPPLSYYQLVSFQGFPGMNRREPEGRGARVSESAGVSLRELRAHRKL